jgi:hypothetical protein
MWPLVLQDVILREFENPSGIYLELVLQTLSEAEFHSKPLSTQ